MQTPDSRNPTLAWQLHEQARAPFLRGLFGSDHLLGASLICVWATRLSSDYDGGAWDFFQLSNGSGYLVPRGAGPFRVQAATNGYRGVMSGGAFGIVVTLVALGELIEFTQSDLCAAHFHALHDFAAYHGEARDIFEAIEWEPSRFR